MAVLACSAPLDTTAPLEPMALAECTLNSDRVPPQAPLDSSTPDSRWAEAARQVPGGWGGLFFEDKALTVYLVDPRQQVEAAQALLEFGIGISGARVKQGRWDFGQLFDWHFYIKSQLGDEEIVVTSSDIDEVRNRLVYGVVDEETQRTTITFLGSLDLPCELVMLEVRGFFHY